MKSFQTVVAPFSLVDSASAWSAGWNGTYITTTITTDIYTTYCPLATTFIQGAHTYTATDSETKTITDCPCTYVTSIPKPTAAGLPHSNVSPPASRNATWIPPVWITTTETVSTLTTYCPVPTTVVQGSKIYKITDATTLTITDCPSTHVTSVPAPSTQGQTYPVASPGTAAILIVSLSPVTPTTPVVVGKTCVPTNTPIATATISGLVQLTNAAVVKVTGVGALAAAGLAILF